MTFATTNPSPVFTGPGIIGYLSGIVSAIRARRTYRRTLTELQSLSPEMLDDLGLTGADLNRVARKATFG